MINTQYINLNMIPGGVLPVLHISQYDIGRPLGVAAYNGGEPVDLTDYTVTIEATRTDGTAITAAVTTTGNAGTFSTTATMTNKADKYPAQLVIVDNGGNRVASLPFLMCVIPAAMDENAEQIAEDESLYEQYNGTVQKLLANTNSRITAETIARQSDSTNLANSISAEAATRQTADATLQSQINQYITPSSQQPDEVVNARVGADGITYANLGTAIRTQIGNTNAQMLTNLTELNSVNLLSQFVKESHQYTNISWTWTGDSVSVVGSPVSTENYNFFSSPNSFPPGILPGGTYKIKYSSEHVSFRVYYYNADSTNTQLVLTRTDTEFTIPEESVGLILRLTAASGTTVNETVTPILYSTPSNKDLEDMIELYTGAMRFVDYLDASIFEKGNIGSDGLNNKKSKPPRMRTACVCAALSDMTVSIDTSTYANAALYLFTYNADGSLIASSGWITTAVLKKGTYFRLIATLDRTSSSDEYTIESIYAELKISVNNYPNVITVTEDMLEQGTISGGSGVESANTARARSRHIYRAFDVINVAIASENYPNAGITTLFYNEDGSLAMVKGWSLETAIPKGSLFRLVLAPNKSSNATPYSVSTIFGLLHIYPECGNRNRSVLTVSHQGNVGTDATDAAANYCKIEGYIRAGLCGFDMAEGDVKFTSDNVPVVSHDNTFTDGTTSETVTISQTTLADLLTHDYHGGVVATLDEVIATCKTYGMDFIIDQYNEAWGDNRYDAIFAVLKKYRYYDHVRHIVYGTVSAGKILAINPRAYIVAGQVYNSPDASAALAIADAVITDQNHVDLMLSVSLDEAIIATTAATMNQRYGIALYRCNTLAQKALASVYASIMITDMSSGIY